MLLNLPIVESDHGMLVLYTSKQRKFERRPYWFEAMWTTHPQCEQMVKEAWLTEGRGSQAFNLIRILNVTRDMLRNWNKNEFGKLEERRKSIEHKPEFCKRTLALPR